MGISLKNYNNNKRTIYRCHSEVIFSFCFSMIRLSNFFFSFHFTSPFSGQKSRVSCYWCPRKRNWWFRATLGYLYTCMLVESWLDNFRCIEWQKETRFYRCWIIFHNFYDIFFIYFLLKKSCLLLIVNLKYFFSNMCAEEVLFFPRFCACQSFDECKF